MPLVPRYPVVPADRITGLDGMTIGLRRNSKHNSDTLLDHLAELLARDFPTATILKFYGPNAVVDLAYQSLNMDQSQFVAETLKANGVDILFAAQGD